jgi:nucleoside 2-deoxyribosyltransferase
MIQNKGLVYLAGPFTGDVETHRYQAVAAAADLRRAGYTVIVPHLESVSGENALDAEGWINHGFELLRRCDFIALFGDWQFSRGTKAELNNAFAWGIPMLCVYDGTGLLLWHNRGVEILPDEWREVPENTTETAISGQWPEEPKRHSTYATVGTVKPEVHQKARALGLQRRILIDAGDVVIYAGDANADALDRISAAGALLKSETEFLRGE